MGIQVVNNHPSTASFEQCKEYFGRVRSTTQKIVQAVGGLDAFCNLPYLEWKEEFHEGGTGYIDGVSPRDMSAPAMRGMDHWARPFVALKTIREGEGKCQISGMIIPPDLTIGPGVETLFQRYSDSPSIWTSGNHYSRCKIVAGSVGDQELERVSQLFKNGRTEALCYGPYQSSVVWYKE